MDQPGADGELVGHVGDAQVVQAPLQHDPVGGGQDLVTALVGGDAGAGGRGHRAGG